MPYEPVEDIPNIDKISIDARKIESLMHRVINSTRFSLKPSNLKRSGGSGKELAALLKHQLLLFGITHGSMREIIKAAVKQHYYPIVADALSLTREQVEKVFIIASLLHSPDKAFRQYLRATWRTEYEAYLLQLEEEAENERFSEFLKVVLPKRLELLRAPPDSKGKREIIVSKFAKRVLKFSWDNPGAKNPSWFKPKKGIQRYIADYFGFATPGKGARLIKDPALRRFLYRWHKEYAFLSQYTHVTIAKIRFADLHDRKDLASQEKIKEYGMRFAIHAVNTSYTATATSCALVMNAVRNSHGAKDELKELWDKLIGFSLTSKAMWEMYVKDLIGGQRQQNKR